MKGHSIELPFSAESKQILFEKLHESGIEKWASIEGFKPHLSLAVIRDEVDNVEPLRELVKQIAMNYQCFTIQLSSMGAFPGKRPVFTLLPAASPELLDAHHTVCRGLQAAAIDPIPYYRKNQWTPHVTLIMGRPRREVSEAMEKLSRIWWPGDYTLDHVELIEFHPAVKLERLALR